MKRKYTFYFSKSTKDYKNGHWKEITDIALLRHLTSLQLKYDFQIIDFQFKSAYLTSHITFKCKKKDRQLILFEFCALCNNYIEEYEI